MLSTIYMICISCKSCDWYKNRIARPNIENATTAKAPVVLGQNICYIRNKYYLFYL